ncbi:hypothetical protein E5S69_31510 [Cupriavidus necator]|uniref:hypothetical protein n=1 Tax=Cupriavidus necator TaxID=106590 RepID=UPI00148F87E6|nr:hypothetical protein [Cupriavidus necator]NOV28015.1 hypothetical protein [Cupriavidus necator]
MEFAEQPIVEFALRKCGVVGTGQTASPEDYATAKEVYDSLLASLPLMGASLSDVSPSAGYTTWVLDDSQKAVWAYGFGYMVAAECCDDFSVPPAKATTILQRASAFRELLIQYAPDKGPINFTVDNG